MAEVTHLAAFVDSTNGTSWTSPSVAAADGTVLLVALGASDASGATEGVVPSAAGLTFVELERNIGGSAGITLWAADVVGGFSGTLALTAEGVSPATHESVLGWIGELTGSSAAASLKVQSAPFTISGAASIEADAGAAAAAANIVLAAMILQDDQSISTDATSLHSTVLDTLSPNRALQVAYRTGGVDETIGFSWSTSANGRGVIIEIEGSDDRTASVSFAEMETSNPPLRGQISFAEMELPDAPVAGTSGWQQADLDGGGGVNAGDASDDGTWLLAGGDISGPKRSVDGGITWENCANGLPDGGQAAAVGGIVIRPGSNTEALYFSKAGVFHTDDQGDSWTEVAGGTFGEGGGTRPRRNVGHIADASGDWVVAIAFNGAVSRYRWSTGVYTSNLISARTGVGNGVAIDPQSPGDVLVGTRDSGSGIWRITGATGGSPSVAAMTGSGRPAAVYDLRAAVLNGTTYFFAAEMGVGIKRCAGGAVAATWTNITPSGHTSRDWQTVAVVTDGSSIKIGAICSNGPQLESGRYAQIWIANNGQAASPTWRGIVDYVNEKGGPGGDPYWQYPPINTKSLLFTNCPIIDSVHSGEDANWFYRDGRWWFGDWGQQGVFIVDPSIDVLYPANEKLGLTANSHVIADPNAPGVFLIPNTDHIVTATQDRGETWRSYENGFPGGTMAGFDIAPEQNAQSFRWFVAFGERSANTDGDIFLHANPFADTNWTSLGLNSALGGRVPQGIEAFRGANPAEGGTTRTFLYMGVVSLGLRRQILSTSGATKVGGLTTISNDACNSVPSGERFEIVYMDTDTLLVLDPTKGLYIVKSARAASPTVWKAWNFSNNASIGENWVQRLSADSAIISIGGGSAKGVYVLEDIATATNGDLFGTDLTRTSIAKPGGGSWRRPGPVASNGTIAIASDLQLQNTYPSGDCQWFETSTAGFLTGWAETTTDETRGLFEKVDGAAVDTEGQVMVSMSGPGAATYILGEGTPGVDDRIAQLAWAEMETGLPPRGAEVSFAELQLPNGARVLDVSFAEMEIPEFARVAQVSWAEMEAPVNETYRSADVSFAVLEVPFRDLQVDVSWVEMEVPDGYEQRPEGAVYVGLSGRILVPIRWRLKRPFGRS